MAARGGEKWHRVAELASSLATRLQLEVLSDQIFPLFSDVNDLNHLCLDLHSGGAGPAPPVCARALRTLAVRTGEYAAASLQRRPGAGEDRVALVQMHTSACLVFASLLCLLEGRVLTLGNEADWARLLTAAALPLQVAPPMLEQLVVGMRALPGVSAALDHAVVLVQTAAQAVHFLLRLLASPHPLLPARVAAVLRASQLKPPRLVAWAGANAMAARACMLAKGTRKAVSLFVGSALNELLARSAVPAVKEEIEGHPECQLAIAELAVHSLALSEEEQAAAVGDGAKSCEELRDLAQVLSADCLAEGRQACLAAAAAAAAASGSSNGGNGSSGGNSSVSLVQAVAGLAAQPALWAARSCAPQGGLLMACLELQAALAVDALDQPGQQAAGFAAEHMQALGSPGGVPLLCRMAAEVAGAAAGGGRGGGGGVSEDFGALMRRPGSDAPGEWSVTLQRYKMLLVCLHEQADDWVGRLAGGDSWRHHIASWRALEALLRLHPLLPGQPSEQGSRVSAGEVLAAAGGAEHFVRLISEGPMALWHIPPDPFLIACKVVALAEELLAAPAPTAVVAAAAAAVPAADATELATAAFGLLSTACRAAHAVCATVQQRQQQGSGGGAGTGANSVFGAAAADARLLQTSFWHSLDVLPMRRVVDLTLSHALRTHRGALVGTTPAADGSHATERVQRRLECCVLLYLPATAALLRLPVMAHVRDEEGSVRRCVLLREVLAEPALAELWRGLLAVGSGAAATGLDVAGVLADVAARAIEETCQAAVHKPQGTVGESDYQPCLAALGMLEAAAQLGGRAVLPRLAQHAPLLQALCNMAGSLCNIGMLLVRNRPPAAIAAAATAIAGAAYQQGGPRAVVWGLLHRLVPHLPIDVEELAPLQQQLAQLPSAFLPLEVEGIFALDKLVKQLPAPGPGSSNNSSSSAAAALPLALRRAHALGCRKCSNPRCADLAGASEAEASGKRCTGCRVARFCSVACSRAEWPQHKLACKALQRQAAGGA